MSAMQTLMHEQSPGFGSLSVCTHLALHFELAMNASTSSLVSISWHLVKHEPVQSLIGGPPLVILHSI
jgi:hypothetical protein